MKKSKLLSGYAWIAVTTFTAMFFAIAVIVYCNAVPKNTTEVLSIVDDDYQHFYDMLKSTEGFEDNKFVTKVYSYGTNAESLDIYCVNDLPDYRMNCTVVEDATAEYNYYVEYFVRCHAENKDAVKSAWNSTRAVTEQSASSLTFTQTDSLLLAQPAGSFGDLKKIESRSMYYIDEHIRVIVKPGYTVNFTDKEK